MEDDRVPIAGSEVLGRLRAWISHADVNDIAANIDADRVDVGSLPIDHRLGDLVLDLAEAVKRMLGLEAEQRDARKLSLRGGQVLLNVGREPHVDGSPWAASVESCVRVASDFSRRSFDQVSGSPIDRCRLWSIRGWRIREHIGTGCLLRSYQPGCLRKLLPERGGKVGLGRIGHGYRCR